MFTVIWCPRTRIIRYNGTTGGFKVNCWWHTTLWTAVCHRKHRVTSLFAQNNLVITFSEMWHKVLTSDMRSSRGCASQTLRVCHMKLGTHLNKLWPYAGSWRKSRVWSLLWVDVLSRNYGNSFVITIQLLISERYEWGLVTCLASQLRQFLLASASWVDSDWHLAT